ncbi:MAG: hypothetical protein COA78_34915 [Blastopirellula sp.]|nr:MAG: hypothetical protein COA78_34915 [Blastopirellula sp.]
MKNQSSASSRKGMAVIETAVLLPFLVLLILGTSELGWYVYGAQTLHNVAREGVRVAARADSTNADVEAAIQVALSNSVGVDSAAVSSRISCLNSQGEELYQVQNLSINENGKAIRVIVSMDIGDFAFATNILGLESQSISCYAVMQRQE